MASPCTSDTCTIDLVGVVPADDSKTRYQAADNWLRGYLEQALQSQKVKIEIDALKFNTYSKAIEYVLARTNRRPFLARMTPYAYVSATMLGAKLDLLGTYESRATVGRLTYQSYFVVNKKHFDAARGTAEAERLPTLEDLNRYLKESRQKPTFLFHDKLSTSSYFLPALWLRGQKIFEKEASAGDVLTAIATKKTDSGTASVQAVAADVTADQSPQFAAVWDGTRNTLAQEDYVNKVYFIALPTELPNDLLVGSNDLAPSLRGRLYDAVAGMKSQQERSSASVTIPGDFSVWRGIQDAPSARQALAGLLKLAAEPLAPVVVDVEAPDDEPELKEALVKAVRLAKPEFVLYDRDYYDSNWDVKWILSRVPHDNALSLTVTSRTPGQQSEEYLISFVDAQKDLTARFTALIHTRLPRVRYLWPYQSTPTILGDIEFTPEDGARVEIEQITWLDPSKNNYNRGARIQASIREPNFFRYLVEWKRSDDTEGFDNPLSTTAFRTILRPPAAGTAWAQPAVVSMLALTAFAIGGLVLDLRRRAPSRPSHASFDEAAHALVRSTHETWKGKVLTAVNTPWCSGPQINEAIEELVFRGGLPVAALEQLGVVRRVNSFGRRLSLPFRAGSLEHERTKSHTIEANFTKLSDVDRCSALLRLLVQYGKLSRFTWPPVEWDALNAYVSATFPGTGGPDTAGEVLRRDSEAVRRVVSKRFSDAIHESTERFCLFRARWAVESVEGRSVAFARSQVVEGLVVEGYPGPLAAIALSFERLSGMDRSAIPAGATDRWIVAKVRNVTHSFERGGHVLNLEFSPIAILKEGAE